MYFESHAHYDDKDYKNDREEVLRRIKEAGVSYVINVGADMKSSKRSMELAEKYDFIFASVGVHPHYASSLHESDMKTLSDMAKINKVVAIGEIGLDFYRNLSPRDVQIYWFKKMLTIAEACNKPVIIHSRDADEEVFKVIKDSNVRRGVIHCWAGTPETAEEYVKMGYYIGVGGTVTYPKSDKLVKSVKAVGLDNILIETDCPYLSPVPKRGSRNDSQNLEYVVKKISEIVQIPPETVCEKTLKNAMTLFDIK